MLRVMFGGTSIEGMDTPSKFLAPGGDGEVAPGTDLWRKGLVCTIRSPLSSLGYNRQNYRISSLYKKSIAAAHPFTGFKEAYRRAFAVANHRISQLTCPASEKMPNPIILGHGWRLIGENIVTALVTLGLGCPDQSSTEVQGEPVPTDEALRSPGGATLEELEELEHLAPQAADEIYNEFDLTDSPTQRADVVTFSYGEPISSGDAIDFSRFVVRAEQMARSYHGLLQTFGEAGSQPFRVRHREWFLASQTFVTIHICFDR
jgi:hypothetical protein